MAPEVSTADAGSARVATRLCANVNQLGVGEPPSFRAGPLARFKR